MPLTWGRGGGRARRGGLTFGSYDPVLALIRIHPVLDRRDVPRYFLESVVYHEMLHHHLGGVPDTRRAHGLPLARLPRGGGPLSLAPPGAWPGRRRTCRTCCGPARSSTASAERRAAEAGAPALGPASRRPECRCATSAGSCPTCAAIARRSPAGLLCLLAAPPRFSVASPWVLRHAIDDLTLAVTRRSSGSTRALIVGLVALEGVFRYYMRMVLIGISREIEYELRNDLFAHLTRLAARYYQRHRIGDLMSRATNDLSAVRMVLGPGHHVHGQHRWPPSWAPSR